MFGGAGYYRKKKGAYESIFAAHFDGTNDLIRNTSSLPVSTEQQGTFSFWLIPTATGLSYRGTALCFRGNGATNGSHFRVYNTGLGMDFFCRGKSAVGLGTYNVANTFNINQWNHVVYSYDFTSPGYMMAAVNGVLELNTTPTLGNHHQSGRVSIGDNEAGGRRWRADTALMWFDSVFVDLSVQANIDKFYSATNPVGKFGSDGSTPLGSQPLIFLKGHPNFQTNFGSWSNFTVTGSLTQGAALP